MNLKCITNYLVAFLELMYYQNICVLNCLGEICFLLCTHTFSILSLLLSNSFGSQPAFPSFPSEPIRAPLFPDTFTYLNPDEATVNIMGVHHVPGSPNTLHRTVATNTPPSPALQRRLGGQSSPALGRRIQTASGSSEPTTPNSPLVGRSGKFIPPSPVLDRQPSPAPVASSPDHKAPSRGRATPDERHGAQSRQSTTSMVQPGPATPTFPLEQSCSPSLFLPLDIRPGSIAGNTESVTADSAESRKTPTPTQLSPQGPAITSIYGKIRNTARKHVNEITKLNRCVYLFDQLFSKPFILFS